MVLEGNFFHFRLVLQVWIYIPLIWFNCGIQKNCVSHFCYALKLCLTTESPSRLFMEQAGRASGDPNTVLYRFGTGVKLDDDDGQASKWRQYPNQLMDHTMKPDSRQNAFAASLVPCFLTLRNKDGWSSRDCFSTLFQLHKLCNIWLYEWVDKDVEGSGCSYSWAAVPEFGWSEWGKPRTTLGRIVGRRSSIPELPQYEAGVLSTGVRCSVTG